MKPPPNDTNRIVAIDTLRGFALLGILPMNITSFAMPYSYFNPTVYGGSEWWNQFVHGIVYVWVDQKFMALFSMLFGASVILFCSKLEQQGQRPARIYFFRNAWLFVFGVVHFVFLSTADILCVYALCALVLFFFRRLAPAWQFLAGLSVFLFPIALYLQLNATLPSLDPGIRTALDESWHPSDTKLERNLAVFRGGYADQLTWKFGRREKGPSSRAGMRLVGLTVHMDSVCRAFGMMLIGMAFYRWGVLTAACGDRFYLRIACVGLGIGTPVAIYGLYQHYAHEWAWDYSMIIGRCANHVATVFITIGYTACFMLLSRSDWATTLRDRLAAVGRMTLTNYIGQSILATVIFYGFGFGWYGYLSRLEQLAVVVGIWSIQIAFSSWWLERFAYGPLEWLWRSATYFRPMAIRV